jgi:hypothetical protein
LLVESPPTSGLSSCKTLYVCVKASSFAARIVFALNTIYRVRASAVVKEMKNVEISSHTNRREVQKMYFQNVCIKIENENTEITNGA